MKVQLLPISTLKPNPDNPRLIKDDKFKKLVASIRSLPAMLELRPIVVNAELMVLGGNMRLKACQAAGLKEVPVVIADALTEAQQAEFVIKDNVSFGEWEWDTLANEWDAGDLTAWGVDVPTVAGEVINHGALAETFLVAPFSVLNSRDGEWQERKRLWLNLGITSDEGRDEAKTAFAIKKSTFAGASNENGLSIFDPVLCEVMYTWFSPVGGVVLDPFAGGSVRGLVASHCHRNYVGIDLRPEQVAANNAQKHLAATCAPVWHCADSLTIDTVCQDVAGDFVFSCPPYADLEVYSNDPADISNMPYPQFLSTYREIIAKTCKLLRENSFACFVVGEVRDKHGAYRNFVADTVQAFLDAGLMFYNEIIFVTPAGSLPIRAGRQFAVGRKIGKTHQNVLIFVKGDAKEASKRCGIVSVKSFDAPESWEALSGN